MNTEQVELLLNAIQTIVAILSLIVTIIIYKDHHPRE